MAQAQRTPVRSGGSSSQAATIGRSARVRGRISGEGDLLVEGAVEGDIHVGGDVTLSGVVEGDIESRGMVHIVSGARVRGNVRSEDISLDEGAEFAGELTSDFELPADLQNLQTSSPAGAGAASTAARRR
jgi:cytoskeletal protein CcmA (bactofilin family)